MTLEEQGQQDGEPGKHTRTNGEPTATSRQASDITLISFKYQRSDIPSEVVPAADIPDPKNSGDNQLRDVANKGAEPNVKVNTDPSEPRVDVDGRWSQWIERMEVAMEVAWRKNGHIIAKVVKLFLLTLYLAYFAYCVYFRYGDEGSYILTAITVFILTKVIWAQLKSISLVRKYFLNFSSNLPKCSAWKTLRKILRYGLYLASTVSVCVYLGLDILRHHPDNAQALLGIAILLCLCFIFSFKPSKVNWHPVFWGFLLQILFAVLTLRTDAGFKFFQWIGDLILSFVRLSDKASNFLFGENFRQQPAGFFIDSAAVMVFFNSCIFMLENWGVLEFVILRVGRALSVCLETGPVESVVAAANIFIGLSEAPVLVRSYLPTITRSELHAIMTCGFCSISGAFMAMFIKAGAPANHLLTASVISAPAGLAISKLMYPEVEQVNYLSQRNVRMRDDSEPQKTAIQAISDGASFSIKLIGSIMVNMLAFVSLMNLVDSLLVWAGQRAGVGSLTFDLICSYILFPVSYVMGVPVEDCGKVGALIGVKMIATPFVAYRDLGNMVKNRIVFQEYVKGDNVTWHRSGSDVILDGRNITLVNGFMSERAEVITTYALCGISAFPAIGFSLGTLVPLCPARKGDVLHVLVRAFIAGNLANFATGAIAGLMYTPV